jgi:hypothetical protein
MCLFALDNNVTTAAGREAQHCVLAPKLSATTLSFYSGFPPLRCCSTDMFSEVSVVPVNDAN